MGEGGRGERRGRGGGGGGGRGICSREERIEEFFLSDAAYSSSIFWKSCLFDQEYVVCCAFLL